MGKPTADTKRFDLRLPMDVWQQVEKGAKDFDCSITTWLVEATKNRLVQNRKPAECKTAYASAVAAAVKASGGKLTRVDAECVAAQVITAFHREGA